MQDVWGELQAIRLELKRLSSSVELLERQYYLNKDGLTLTRGELKERKALAKGKDAGEVAQCPACGVSYTKTNGAQIFCVVEHKHLFNTMLDVASE
jgi:hypothetical protein